MKNLEYHRILISCYIIALEGKKDKINGVMSRVDQITGLTSVEQI